MSDAKEAHINSERAELLRRYDKGEPVDQGPLLDALTWRLRNQAKEITRLAADRDRLRAALEQIKYSGGRWKEYSSVRHVECIEAAERALSS